MFKNLKKKIEDVGADLSTLSPLSSPGTLGSSTSSLRRTVSKTSSLSHSRESLQSENSSKIIPTFPISEEFPKESNENFSSFQSDATDLLTRTYAEETEPSSEFDAIKDGVIGGHFANKDWFPVQEDFVDFSEKNSANFSEKKSVDFSKKNSVDFSEKNSADFSKKNSADFSKKNSANFSEKKSVDFSEKNSADFFGFGEGSVADSSPVLVPVSPLPAKDEEVSSDGICEKILFEKKIENLKSQLLASTEENATLSRRLASQESDRSSFRTELDRLKGIAAQNLVNSERLGEANAKNADLIQQLESVKLEKESWKIAHDQVVQRVVEKAAALQTAQKKNAESEVRIAQLNSSAAESKKGWEKLKEENFLLKNAKEILEKQVDKFIGDLQTEKICKEKAKEEIRQLAEQNSAAKSDVFHLEEKLRHLEEELRREKSSAENARQQSEEMRLLEESLRATKETEKENAESFRLFQDSNFFQMAELQDVLSQKNQLLTQMTEDLRGKNDSISALESSIGELEARLKTLEENLESKEATLAVFRRRSAKDTEIKLRERDKQIANLEKQLTELTDRVSVVDVKDNTNCEYTKNVLLKFLSGNGEERLHLIRPVSVLLQLTETEESWLKDVIAWKQSWLPGPKPELDHNGHSHSNGSGLS